jgi:molecular chaperone GrpE
MKDNQEKVEAQKNEEHMADQSGVTEAGEGSGEKEWAAVETLEDELPSGAPAGETVAAEEKAAAQIATLTAENRKLNDRLLRLAAEFDNYRKRNDREAQNYIINANSDLLSKLLPALDDLDRILSAGVSGTEPGALLEGIALLQKNMVKVFQDAGLEPMQTVGEVFDPMLHDALLHIEVQGIEPNRIVEEHKKGYFFKGKVLRHAQVVVSK